MKPLFRILEATSLVAMLAGGALAQSTSPNSPGNPSTKPEEVYKLDLTDAQRQMIVTSVVNTNMKNESPPNFQPIVGATVPQAVSLEKPPATVIEFVPRMADFQIARIANQVAIVDPQSRRVVDVVSAEKR